MKLSNLQRHCLDKMGIQWFEKRLAPVTDYLLCIDEIMSDEKQQLLARMLVALRWTTSHCVNLCVSGMPSTEALRLIQEKSAAISAKKRIIFSDQADVFAPLNEKGSTIVLPSLKTLLTDVQAKKVAWAKMQPLITT